MVRLTKMLPSASSNMETDIPKSSLSSPRVKIGVFTILSPDGPALKVLFDAVKDSKSSKSKSYSSILNDWFLKIVDVSFSKSPVPPAVIVVSPKRKKVAIESSGVSTKIDPLNPFRRGGIPKFSDVSGFSGGLTSPAAG